MSVFFSFPVPGELCDPVSLDLGGIVPLVCLVLAETDSLFVAWPQRSDIVSELTVSLVSPHKGFQITNCHARECQHREG